MPTSRRCGEDRNHPTRVWDPMRAGSQVRTSRTWSRPERGRSFGEVRGHVSDHPEHRIAGMSDVNINRPTWDLASWGAALGRRTMRLGPSAGASELGVTLYEVDPGRAVSPFHVHHANEELLLVLSGHPALRTPAGIRHLERGDLVAFPRGPAGAHRISNPSEDVV